MFFEETLFGYYELAIILKLLLAGLAGGLIGLEREKRGHPAGLRTNLLVALGSCTIMIISEAFYLKYGSRDVGPILSLDPSRTAAQIVVGIGFLGAGVIIKHGATVRGLTTAAGLWVVSGLGMAFGMGFFFLGAVTTLIVLVGLLFLKKVDEMIGQDRYVHLSVTARRRDTLYDELRELMRRKGAVVKNLSSRIDLMNDELSIRMVIRRQGEDLGAELVRSIQGFDGIKQINYRVDMS